MIKRKNCISNLLHRVIEEGAELDLYIIFPNNKMATSEAINFCCLENPGFPNNAERVVMEIYSAVYLR